MRRKDKEVTGFQELVDIIERCDVCRIAMNGEDGVPYIVPLNFGLSVEGESVTFYFHSAEEGRKMDLLRADSRVSFELDRGHRLVATEGQGYCTMEYECVMGKGRIEFVPEGEKMEALRLLMAHYRKEDFPFDTSAVPETAVYKLTVESMTGKRKQTPRPVPEQEG